MRKIKFLTMAMAAVMLAGFVSCSKDNVDNADGDDANNTHMIINISAIDNTPGTKGAEDSGTHDPGTADEYEVKTLDLFFFNGSGFVEHIALGSGDITSTGLPAGTEVAIAKTRKIEVSAGTYDILTIVNYGGTVPTLAVGNPISTLQNALIGNTTYTTSSTNGLITSVPGTGLMMASRTKESGVTSPISNLTITPANTINNPAELKVTMERVVAKLTLSSPTVTGKITAANTYEVGTGDAECSIEVESFVVANLRNEGYIFRHAWNPAGSATGYGDIDDTALQDDASNPFKYVWDPKSASKTYTAGSPLASGYEAWYHRHVTTLSSATISNTISMSGYQPADGNKLIGYCLENTALAASQRDGYSTGVIFRAKIIPTTVYWDNAGALDTDVGASNGTVFYCGGKFYKTTSALVLDPGTPFNNVAELNAMTAKQLSDLGIEKYNSGICYYNYWIKHQDNSNSTMGMMEYGIVRNNTYRMQITEIKRPGEGDIFITPEDPNEKVNLYLSVEMQILPWIVRANNIVFD